MTMSDYATLRELYYEALQMIPPEGGARSGADGKMSEALRRDLEMYSNRNPEPKVEPALQHARTQAEWHKAQQNLVISETPPEQLALAQGVSEGVEASKQQGEQMAEARQKEAADRVASAKRELEEMRQGSGSAPQPDSAPGVPAPVQGQTQVTHPPTQAELQASQPKAEPKKENGKK
jgi:hypothetical protein